MRRRYADLMVVSLCTVRITLDDRIEPGARTVFTHTASSTRTCLGYLPGDADGDGTTSASDILRLIDHLNGFFDPPMQIWQCDLDRSGLCAPADILRVIDLLNGADAFEPWLSAQLPPCPSSP